MLFSTNYLIVLCPILLYFSIQIQAGEEHSSSNHTVHASTHGHSPSHSGHAVVHGKSSNHTESAVVDGKSSNHTEPTIIHGKSSNHTESAVVHGKSSNHTEPTIIHGKSSNHTESAVVHGKSSNHTEPTIIHGKSLNHTEHAKLSHHTEHAKTTEKPSHHTKEHAKDGQIPSEKPSEKPSEPTAVNVEAKNKTDHASDEKSSSNHTKHSIVDDKSSLSNKTDLVIIANNKSVTNHTGPAIVDSKPAGHTTERPKNDTTPMPNNATLNVGKDPCQNDLDKTDIRENIFSSKTIYETALNYLKNKTNQIPDAYSRNKSLLDEHRELEKKSCHPFRFYFLGRHAARFPKNEKIEKYNRDLLKLQEKLKKSSSLNQKCPGKLNKFLNWHSKLEPKQDYLITELGGREEQNLARRFKAIYPKFFNTQTSDYDLAVTSKIRTSQTGVEFMKLVRGFKFPNCNSESLPTNDVDNANFNPDKILSDSCYKGLMRKEVEEFLQFHERCKKSLKKSKESDDQEHTIVRKLKSPKAVQSIVDKVSAKLGVQIDDSTLDSIAHMCIYEIAIRKQSIWCNLLDQEDAKILDYIEDANAYIKDSYGPDSNIKQACPLIKNLVNTIKNPVMHPLRVSPNQLKSYFYFTHDHALKKVLPTFGLFKDDASYSEARVEEFLNTGKVPENRNYRASLSVPFSGNFAFILYKCPRNMGDKLLIALNEQPIKIAGCDNQVACDAKKFVNAYSSAFDCNLNKICPI